MRICIVGGPRTGKTTLAHSENYLSYRINHTDDLIPLGWSEASDKVLEWLNDTRPHTVIEGVATVRALRKFMDQNPGRPCDKVIRLETPRVPLTKGQEIMTKGEATIWREILPELRKRGVQVEVRT